MEDGARSSIFYLLSSIFKCSVSPCHPVTVSPRHRLERRGARMPAKNADLHGNVPDTADIALLLIDMINDLEFEGSEELLRYLPPVAEHIAALKRRAKQAGVPVV